MTAKILHIGKAIRYPCEASDDTLELKEGVNVIVGELNAGKTKWLQMIDFALGDRGKAEEAFDQELADKYDRITLTLDIGGNEINVERRWKEPRAKSKIFVNDGAMTMDEFSEFMLTSLNIPLIRVPSGSPYGDRTWPILSWRELLRHMYKQERFWSDFAQKQPDVTRSACILHFLNAGASQYPKEFGDLVSKKKERDRLEAEREVFVRVLQDVAVDVLGQPEMTVAVTPDSIGDARKRLAARLIKIEEGRREALGNFDHRAIEESPAFGAAKEKLESLHRELGEVESERNAIVRRSAEISQYIKTMEGELARFARAKAGVHLLGDLRVTHCPGCERELPDRSQTPDVCPVCGRPRAAEGGDVSQATQRIDFEEEQVKEELNELRKLIEEIEREHRACDIQIDDIKERIRAEKRSVDAAASLSVRAMPPEIALLDQEAGRISAQLQQLDRVEHALGSREDMSAKIAKIDEEVVALEMFIKLTVPPLNYQVLGDLLSDRMNSYLNMVNTDSLSRWKTGRISVRLRKDSFELYLDEQPWTIRAGGTAYYIIQIAYHYALFSLSKDGQYNYPGFLIIDFPPHFAKADDLRDSENYLLKPFVDLCAKEEMAGSQVIIAGRAFDDLAGANMIHL